MNVEYWGAITFPAGVYTTHNLNNSYKSLRIVSQKQTYMFNRWCTNNQTELYDTTKDPYELTNLAVNPSNETQRLINRLSGLLLVTKSCAQDSCRKPWEVLSAAAKANFTTLDQAMSSKYDNFFASLPTFGFKQCLVWQSVENEGPYYPPSSASLGSQYRKDTSNYTFYNSNGTQAIDSLGMFGSWQQRGATFADLMADARNLTAAEIGSPTRLCTVANAYCGQTNTGGD